MTPERPAYVPLTVSEEWRRRRRRRRRLRRAAALQGRVRHVLPRQRLP